MPLEGIVPPAPKTVDKYVRGGWWLDITFGDVLDRTASRSPDREALVDGRTRLTYAEIRDRVDRLATGLASLGIKRGDCVLLQLPDWAEFVDSFYALQRIGAVAVLLLARHRQIEINYFCRLTGAKAWILPERHGHADYLPIITDVRKANPGLEHVVLVRSQGKAPFVRYEDLLAGSAAGRLGRKPAPTDVAFVIPTGGTTGLPKAVPRTHNDAICDARFKAEARGQTGADTCLFCVPLEHNLGLAALNGTIFTGGQVVLLDSTRPEDICAAIQRERVTCAPLVPALLSRLAGFDRLAEYDLISLRAFYVGGARTPAEDIRRVRERLGNVYMTAFGMSEGPSCSTRRDDSEDIILNTIGRPCCPGDEFQVIDGNGRELPRDVEGELVARGPGVFTGYLANPEEDRRAFVAGGFFRTGDLAVIDSAGNIRITGRIKDIIIRGGENISPGEIEALLRGHPDVVDVAVVGMPDPELGERACAYVVPRGPARPTLESVVAFLRERGASVLQLPERFELIDQIPLTALGKADKKALREDVKKRLTPRPGTTQA